MAEKRLDTLDLEIDSRSATTVMTVAGGYPEAYNKGDEITGFEAVSDAIVFHAGTTIKEGKVVTNGGRVMAVTAFGNTYKEALEKSYENVAKLDFKGMYYRKDLGFDL